MAIRTFVYRLRDRMVASVSEMERVRVIAALTQTALFGALDRSVLDALAAGCVQRTYARDQVLWYQGDAGDRLVVIAAGLVKVVVLSANGDQMVLATVGPPSTLGELAIVDHGPRSASVVAVEKTTVLMIERAVLLELIRTHPPLLDALLASIGSLLRRLTEQASDLVFLDLGGRVAKLLIRLAEQQSGAAIGPVTLDLALTQTDLAHMVGASRPAVNRILQGLSARGLLNVDGQTIVLHDFQALRRRAGLGPLN